MTIQEILARLSEFDFITIIDASGSTDEAVKAGSKTTRWEAMQETATSFSRDMDKIDSDGIDVVTFSGSGIQTFTNVTADKVKEVFAARSPRGSTPLAEALTTALKLKESSNKKKVFVVWTDGIPDDKDAVAKVIIDQANKQETDDECTFLFIQVGDDAKATAYLKTLDNDLTDAKFDIVCALTVAEAEAFASTAEMIIHAIDN